MDGQGDALVRTGSHLALLPTLQPWADTANTACCAFQLRFKLALESLISACSRQLLPVCVSLCLRNLAAFSVAVGRGRQLPCRPAHFLCSLSFFLQNTNSPVLLSLLVYCLRVPATPGNKIQTLRGQRPCQCLHIYVPNAKNFLLYSTVQ